MRVATSVECPVSVAQYLDGSVSDTGRELRSLVAEIGATVERERQADIVMRLARALRSDEPLDVSGPAFDVALGLLNSLPPLIPLPDVEIEPDGQLALDWHVSPRRVLSLSVGPQGTIGFAALLGSEPVHGRTAFAGTLPRTVRHLLDRLFA